MTKEQAVRTIFYTSQDTRLCSDFNVVSPNMDYSVPNSNQQAKTYFTGFSDKQSPDGVQYEMLD